PAPAHPRCQPAARPPLHSEPRAPDSAHPRCTPGSRPPLQIERRAPDSGHPRCTPGSRPPLQIERRAPDSGHPRCTPGSGPPGLDHRLASDGGAPAPRCPVVRNAMTPLEPDAPGYPALLRAVPSPPALWVRGALAADDALAVAIVGARRATPYGLATAERVAAELAARGVTIVSGFARGIDSAAHRGA